MNKQKMYTADNYLPLMFIVGILPFIVRFYVYDARLEGCYWFGGSSTMTDFFSYYKSVFFLIVSVYMGGTLLGRYCFYHNSYKKNQIWWIAASYAICIMISTLLSQDHWVSIWGNYERFEGIFVLLSYLLCCYFSYQICNKVSKLYQFWLIFIPITIAMIFIGFFQFTGNDLFQIMGIQKLIVPKQYWSTILNQITSILAKATVYLSLANPNYASIYLAMLLPAVLLVGRIKPKYKILSIVLAILIFVLQIGTFSRVGLICMFCQGLFFLWFARNFICTYKKYILYIGLILLLAFGITDGVSQFRFSKRLLATIGSFQTENYEKKLKGIETLEDEIKIIYGASTVSMKYKFGEVLETALNFYDEKGTPIPDMFHPITGIIQKTELSGAILRLAEINGAQVLQLQLDEQVWNFSYADPVGYLLAIGKGKYDKIEEIEKINLHGIEHMASGRFYIWSRTIPLLKKYGVFGSGPGTFYLVYPQNDYIGKANYANNPYTIIEKPHNMYLLTALENGMVALVLFLLFYGTYFIQSLMLYTERGFLKSCLSDTGICIFLMTIAYMVGGFFNDSTINVTPLFYVILGLGIAVNEKVKANEKDS